MNKLVVDKELNISDYEGDISYALSDNIINISGRCLIYDFNNNKNVTINLMDNSYLKYYKVCTNMHNTSLIINQNNNTYLDYREVIISNIDFNYRIDTVIKGNNNVSKTNLRCLNKLGTALIHVNGKVLESTHNNELLEDIRGLNISNNDLVIKPDMQISSLDVSANHKVTISNVKDEEVFYLESKGVSNSDANRLLTEGFIFAILPDNMKEYIKWR